MNQRRLMRVWYKSDANSEEGSIGMFSSPFPWRDDSQIVHVDWQSAPGEVEVTWLVSAP
jgi:hypothetical protein